MGSITISGFGYFLTNLILHPEIVMLFAALFVLPIPPAYHLYRMIRYPAQYSENGNAQ